MKASCHCLDCGAYAPEAIQGGICYRCLGIGEFKPRYIIVVEGWPETTCVVFHIEDTETSTICFSTEIEADVVQEHKRLMNEKAQNKMDL